LPLEPQAAAVAVSSARERRRWCKSEE
jgi:hypothetical protein